MKKKLYIIYIAIALFLALSCNDDSLLDVDSNTTISEDKVFQDPALIELYLNDLYLDMPNFDFSFPFGLYDNITDESRSYWGDAPRNVVQGQWFPDYNPMEYWEYGSVRNTNTFLTEIEGSPITDEERSTFKGEVKFLRAKLYFDMIKRYGGVPIITEPQDLSDDLFVNRETIDGSFEFVIKELEEAADLLPDSYGDRSTDVAKANKYAAKALLGRVLLFWASPLYNPTGDASRWTRAANMNKEVIDAGVYSLLPEFRNIMLEKNNQEEIISVQFLLGSREHGWDSWHQPDSQSKNFAVARSPVQEFVDAFEMQNGKAIDDPASGYDPTNPYENRDPRFQKTVLVNGTDFFGNTIYMYVGAIDGINEPYATITGYGLRKGTNETNTTYSGASGSDQNWIELRFAEVLLNYAEAQNEALGSPDQSVYDAVERIRQRAGLNPYQLPSGLTKDEMREKIRHERYIELAFESKRYWDLRRWKIAKEVLDGKQFSAMYITKEEDGSYAYEVKPVDGVPCVFQEKMYFMPIPQGEIEKNPNLSQNTEW